MAAKNKNKGITVEFKATSGGSYTAVDGVQKIKLPYPDNAAEEVTDLDDAVIVEANTINDQGMFEMEIIEDLADTTHIALRAAVGAGDVFIQVSLPSQDKKITFSGNAKTMTDADRTAKNYCRVQWKMHCNVEPTIADIT